MLDLLQKKIVSVVFPYLPLADYKLLLEFPISNACGNYHIVICVSFLLPSLSCLKILSRTFQKSQSSVRSTICLLVISAKQYILETKGRK